LGRYSFAAADNEAECGHACRASTPETIFYFQKLFEISRTEIAESGFGILTYPEMVDA
jgi:hypothetical protein